MGNNSKKEQTRGKAVSQLTAILEVTNPETWKALRRRSKISRLGKNAGIPGQAEKMDKIQEVTEKVIDLFDNHNLSVEEGILVIERLKTAIKMYRLSNSLNSTST